jgi:hypothetical protein
LNGLEHFSINGFMAQTFENRLALAQLMGKSATGWANIQVLLNLVAFSP